MSQVEVPRILATVPGRTPPPTAPKCASQPPTATVMPAGSPSRRAHSAVSTPALWSEVEDSSYRRSRMVASRGSRRPRKSASGRPPQVACHIALWPAAARPRRSSRGAVVPVSRPGIQSQCSVHDQAAAATSGSARSTCSALAQNHSEEYTPPE